GRVRQLLPEACHRRSGRSRREPSRRCHLPPQPGRRIRQAARRSEQVHAPLRQGSHSADERLLVDHALRLRWLPGCEHAQSVCSQKLDAVEVQCRRIARPLLPERKSRRGPGSQLASGAQRPVQFDDAHLCPEVGGAHREVEPAASDARANAPWVGRSIAQATGGGFLIDRSARADRRSRMSPGCGRAHPGYGATAPAAAKAPNSPSYFSATTAVGAPSVTFPLSRLFWYERMVPPVTGCKPRTLDATVVSVRVTNAPEPSAEMPAAPLRTAELRSTTIEVTEAPAAVNAEMPLNLLLETMLSLISTAMTPLLPVPLAKMP